MTLESQRKQLLGWIDAKCDRLVSFLSRLVRSAGPSPGPDEHTDIEEWIGVAKTHALSAPDCLMGDATT
jgi:hypothetical protein